MGGRGPMTNGRGMAGNMGMGSMPFQSHMHGGGGIRPPGGFMPPGPPGGLGFGFGDGKLRLLYFLLSARRACSVCTLISLHVFQLGSDCC